MSRHWSESHRRTDSEAPRRTAAQYQSLGRVATILALMTLSLAGCMRPSLNARPVSIKIDGPHTAGAVHALGAHELPYVSAYVLSCLDDDCEDFEAIGFDSVGDDESVVRMTDVRCTDNLSECELVFTPTRQSVTAWLKDGTYGLIAHGYKATMDVPVEYCLIGGTVVFEVGLTAANAANASLGTCDDVVYFDSGFLGEGDGSAVYPYNSLDEALTAVPEGGTIYVLPGVHEFNTEILIDKPVTLAGLSTISQPETSPQFQLSGGPVAIEADNVTVSGLRLVVDPVGGPDAAVEARPGLAGGPLLNPQLKDTTIVARKDGVLFTDTSGATLDNVTVWKHPDADAEGSGILLIGVHDATIRSTTVGDADPDRRFTLGSIGLVTHADGGIEGVAIDAATIQGLDGSGAAKGRTLYLVDNFSMPISGLAFEGMAFTVKEGPAGCDGGRITGTAITDYARSEIEAISIATTCTGDASATAIVRALAVQPDGSLVEGTHLFVGPGMSIQAAVNAALAGDTVHVRPGTELTNLVVINKAITVSGANGDDPDTHLVLPAGTNTAFSIQAAATLTDLVIEVPENRAANVVTIQADDVTIKDSAFFGRFDAGDLSPGNSVVSRGLEVAYGSENLNITGNVFYDLRQPAYFNGSAVAPTTGTVSGNAVYGTFGWVVAGAELAFEGNYWNEARDWSLPSGNSKCDIALLAGTPSSPYDPIADLVAANGGTLLNLGSGDNSCDQR